MQLKTYRNQKLLDLALIAPKCFMCGVNNVGQLVSAHANRQDMGKGMAHKAADIPAFLCSGCHDWYDGRSYSRKTREERESEWDKAALKSIRWALENHPEVFR